MSEEIEELVDLMFDTDMEEVMKEKSTLEYIHKLQQENKQLKEIVYNLTTMTVYGDRKQIKNTAQYKLELAEQKINKAIEYIKTDDFWVSQLKAEQKLLEILEGKNEREGCTK